MLNILIPDPMKTKTLLSTVTFFLIINLFAQKSTLDLTFTAIDYETFQQLDSVKIINRSLWQVDTTLYYPDTLFVLTWFTGLNESIQSSKEFQVFQNYPNPVKNHTTLSIYVPLKDYVNITCTDLLGRIIINDEIILAKGLHSFKFEPGNGNLFIFAAEWREQSSSIKIVNNNSNSSGNGSLKYLGSNYSTTLFKNSQATQSFSFTPGDTLIYVGYANGLESGILDVPETDETFTFQFTYDTICPGIPEVTYEGQVYTTVQIFSQCWLHENLNIGMLIPTAQNMEDNDTIEKYCYNNLEEYCVFLGGLYQWDEMMQYNTQNEQGICPPDWHLPSDEEWKILEGAADSLYGIGDIVWDELEERGFDAGTNLKGTSSWSAYGAGTDLYGFFGWGGGYRSLDSLSVGYSYFGCFWTYTMYGAYGTYYPMGRILNTYFPSVHRNYYDGAHGYSVRCIKD